MEVLGSNNCIVEGLSVSTDFIIEGTVAVTQQPIEDNQCIGFPVRFNATSELQGLGTMYYQWIESSDGGVSYHELIDQSVYFGTDSPTLEISDNTGLDGFIYKLAVTTSQCAAVESDEVILNILTGSICGEGLENIPNAFSPNGDGVNDVWVIEGIQNYPLNKVQVFNRWGALIYEANMYNNIDIRFDGNSNKDSSTSLGDDTYFYIVDLGDGSEILQGYLVINR